MASDLISTLWAPYCSACSPATNKGRTSATTRKNPAAPATSITATWSPTCASASVSKCAPATNTPPPKACPDSGRPSKNSPATNGPPMNKPSPPRSSPSTTRDRADAENCFDELKNQWGWNGYTSRRLASSRHMANLVALIYNWWNLYLRFYDEEHHREAIHTRPMLMSEWVVRSKAAAKLPSKSASCTKKATTSPEPSPRSATSCITSAPSRSDGAWTNAGRCC